MVIKHVKRIHVAWWLVLALLAVLVFAPLPLDTEKKIEPLALPPQWQEGVNELEAEPKPVFKVVDLTVAKGSTLETLLNPHGVSRQDIYRMAEQYPRLLRLRPGHELQLFLTQEDQFYQLVVKWSQYNHWVISRSSQAHQTAFDREEKHTQPITRVRFAHGNIEDSVYLAGIDAGLDDGLIMHLIHLFSWDIDFSREVRQGDRFNLIYEQEWQDGDWVNNQNILAADFYISGERYSAFRYRRAPDKGVEYFDLDGKNLRKTFSRNPVKDVRITSRFSLGRMHPVLHRIRAHKGVDYGAKTGTPVYATGNGRIASKRWSNSYGNVIEIQHAGKYRTVYAHLSEFAKGLAKGQSVRQGQLIGRVGATGMVSGPHLHYEFRINGKHVDPLKVKFPASKPLSKEDMPAFEQWLKPFDNQLQLINQLPGLAKPTLWD